MYGRFKAGKKDVHIPCSRLNIPLSERMSERKKSRCDSCIFFCMVHGPSVVKVSGSYEKKNAVWLTTFNKFHNYYFLPFTSHSAYALMLKHSEIQALKVRKQQNADGTFQLYLMSLLYSLYIVSHANTCEAVRECTNENATRKERKNHSENVQISYVAATATTAAAAIIMK